MVLVPLDSDSVDTLEPAVAVRDELLGRDAVLAGILAKVRRNFAVTVVDAEDPRPLRPRVVVAAGGRGLGQELKVGDREGAVAERRADTIVTGVATADDDNYRRKQRVSTGNLQQRVTRHIPFLPLALMYFSSSRFELSRLEVLS
jgi:hypothetical protein